LADSKLLNDIRAIVFDAVGTLIHPRPTAPVVYARVARQFGSELETRVITNRFLSVWRQEDALDFRLGLRTSEEHEVARWKRIVEQVLDDVSDPEACFRRLFSHFGRPSSWSCDAEAADTIAQLSALGLKLGLASNYDRRLHSVVAGLPALQPIQYLVISSEVGWRKPAPQFFACLSNTIDCPADTILYVGDDEINDYEGAAAVGLRSVLFDPHRKAEPTLRTIASLSELLTQ
jgi:putative hydrolase of the HAD superfamily